MTNDLELSPNLLENEEDDDNVSQISLSSRPGSDLNPAVDEEQNEDLPAELHEVLHINEENEGDELTQFIDKARREGFNCLDLSKKNISEFPETLLEFPSLQVNYSIKNCSLSNSSLSISICI